mgnify:FL=1
MVSLKIEKGFEPIVFSIDGISSCYVVSISPQKEVTTLQHSRLENVPLGSIHKQRRQFFFFFFWVGGVVKIALKFAVE